MKSDNTHTCKIEEKGGKKEQDSCLTGLIHYNSLTKSTTIVRLFNHILHKIFHRLTRIFR